MPIIALKVESTDLNGLNYLEPADRWLSFNFCEWVVRMGSIRNIIHR